MADNKASAAARMADGLHQVALRAVRAVVQQGVVTIDAERCKGCELCVYECPAHTLRLSEGVNARGFHNSEQARPDHCIGCACCALICPDACITVFRHTIVPDGLREEIQRQ